MMYYVDGRWVDDLGMEIPMPGRSHEDMGDFSLPKDFHKSQFYRIEWSPSVSQNDFSTTIEYTMFRRERFYGPAPYVGDYRIESATYVWDAWVAADGRWIGGEEAILTWRYAHR